MLQILTQILLLIIILFLLKVIISLKNRVVKKYK